MEMFLMVLALSIAGVLVSGVLFAVATRERESVVPTRASANVAEEARFFMLRPALVPGPAVPGESLVLQIERHVRLERAVAEGFLQVPTVEALRARTLSPLAW